MSIIAIVLLGIMIFAVLLIILCIGSFNQLVHLRNLKDEAWSNVDVYLKQRYDLIPNLVSTVKGYATHEQSVFEQVTRLRSQSMNASNIAEKSAAESGLAGALKSLFAVAENYPELKANQNFLELQRELSSLEQQIQMARRYYNGTTRVYNSAVQTFPKNVLAGMFGFSPAQYFELGGEAERENPKVQF